MSIPAGFVQKRCDICCWCCLGKLRCSLLVMFSITMSVAADLISGKLCYLLQVLLRKVVFFAAGQVLENIVCCRVFFLLSRVVCLRSCSVLLRKAMLFAAGRVQEGFVIYRRSCSWTLF